MDEKKIFNALKILDNRTLKILVDYYSNVNQNDNVFRSDSRDTQVIDEEIDLDSD